MSTRLNYYVVRLRCQKGRGGIADLACTVGGGTSARCGSLGSLVAVSFTGRTVPAAGTPILHIPGLLLPEHFKDFLAFFSYCHDRRRLFRFSIPDNPPNPFLRLKKKRKDYFLTCPIASVNNATNDHKKALGRDCPQHKPRGN